MPKALVVDSPPPMPSLLKRVQEILGLERLRSDQDLVRVVSEHVFGEPERSRRWLRTRKRQFHGRTPLQLMGTEAGARLVEELLYRIDDGIAA